MTIKESAAYLSVSTKTIWRMLSEGRFPSIYYSRKKRLIDRKDLDKWIQKRRRFEEANAQKIEAMKPPKPEAVQVTVRLKKELVDRAYEKIKQTNHGLRLTPILEPGQEFSLHELEGRDLKHLTDGTVRASRRLLPDDYGSERSHSSSAPSGS